MTKQARSISPGHLLVLHLDPGRPPHSIVRTTAVPAQLIATGTLSEQQSVATGTAAIHDTFY